jgi:hypothetical protein
MDRLPSEILICVKFWVEYGLQLDLSTQIEKICFGRVKYAGPVSPVQSHSCFTEDILGVEEVDRLRRVFSRWS